MITQGELGEELGLSWQDVERLEAGAERISAGQLAKISQALDVPIRYFFVDVVDPVRELRLPCPASHEELASQAAREDACQRLREAFSRIESKSVRSLLVDLAAIMAKEDPPSSSKDAKH